MGKTACIIGATGLVGSKLLNLLISSKEYEKVKVFSRRKLGFDDEKIEENIINFDDQEEWCENVTGDVLFSCLGTTLKVAGSKNEQFKTDFTYQYNFAFCASKNKVREYVLISSAGANPESQIFYSQMKGQLDQAIKGLDFERIRILKPSVLVGNRMDKRAMENITINTLNFIVKILPFMKKYAPIKDYRVAEAMVKSLKDHPEIKTKEYNLSEVLELANSEF